MILNKPRHPGEWRPIAGGLIWCRHTDERTAKIVAAYREGQTLEEIGASLGITRERVRQIIARFSRFNGPVVGGALARAATRKIAMAQSRDERYLAKHGCTFAEYRAILRAGGCEPYRSQRGSAGDRGIDWCFTLASWWAVWQASGKWERRGCAADKYVMARFGDAGPYSPSNVYITTLRENSRDYYRHRRERAERVAA